MTPLPRPTRPSRVTPRHRPVRLASGGALVALLATGLLATSADAAAVVVPLGTASAFSVLAGSTVTNTGTTTIQRSVGVSPGTAITGASTMTVGGTYHSADAVALQAKDDLDTAYTNAEGQSPRNAEDDELGGETLVGGVYNRPAAMALTGQLTLDGADDPNSVWVFQAGTTLTTASASSITLIRGANPCNVFWQVGSSATLGTGSTFVGTVMADQSITMDTGATLQGRVLARVAAVNLHANTITTPNCAYDTQVVDGTTTPTPVAGSTASPSASPSATPSPAAGATPGSTGGNGAGSGGNGGGGSGASGNGNGNGSGNGTTDTQPQVSITPSGAVDTGYVGRPGQVGYAGPGTRPDALLLEAGLGGLVLAAGLGTVGLSSVRRRRR